ncbi:MAG: GAF domain-containing protein, partial [Candidatus Dormibacteraceae bacterium]
MILDSTTAQGDVVRALYEVAAAAATGESDPAGIAQMATDHAIRLLGADGGVVFMWDEAAHLLQPVYQSASASPELPLRPGEGMAGTAFQTRRPAAVEDYRLWEGRLASAAARGMAGAVAVPMMAGEGPTGALGLWTYRPRRFHDQEIQLLGLFAAHLAPVLQGVRGLQERQRQSGAYRALHELSVAASGVLDPGALGRLVVDRARDILRADSATLRWWDPGGGSLNLLATNDVDATAFEVRTPSEAGASGLVFRTRTPIAIGDYRSHALAHRGAEGWNIRSVVAVPLVVGDGAVGTLVAASHTERNFDAADVDVLSLLAAQVAPALVAARLAQERSDQATTFQTLYQVALLVSGVLEPEVLMDWCVETARRVLHTDHATLLLLDEEAGILRCLRDTAGALIGTDVRPGEGAVGAAFERREPVLVQDYPSWSSAVPAAVKLGYQSAIAIPLLVHDRAIGTIGVLSLKPRAFTGEEVQVMALLAGLVGPALESARLHADLSRSEARFRSLYGNMSGGVLVQGPTGQIVDANEQAARIFGVPPGEMLGRSAVGNHDIEVLDEDGRPVPVEARPTAAAIGTRQPVRDRVHRYLIRGRPPLWLRVDAVPVIDESGELKQVVTSFFDITELRLAEAELGESRRRLAEVVAHAPVVLFTIDTQGVVTFSEGSGLRLIGLRPGERVGRSIWELYPADHPLAESVRRGLAGESGAVLLNIADRLLDTTYGPIYDASGQVIGVTGVCVDVTERHRADEARRESEAKSRFLAAMSHELRTPLNSILGFAQLLGGLDFGPLNERQRRYVSYVESSGRHLLELINDVLDLSKVQAGQMEINLDDLDPSEVARDAVARMRPLAAGRGLRLRTRMRGGLRVRADRRRLTQVLLNFLSNAIKFTDEGGDVLLTIRRRGAVVRLAVTDTG